jgi:MoaA/NifB/PqqE/SkfB family radical SAM enzyme
MQGALYMDGTKLDRHLDEVVRWRRGEWFAPIHMELSLTNVCNQHCTFCYIDWSHGKTRMSDAMVERLVRDAQRIGVKSCLVAGEGEPTVNKAYLRAIEVAGEVGLDIALNSNMVTVDEEEIARFLPHLSWLRMSVQAPERTLYAAIHQAPESHFDKMLANVRACVETKRRLGLDVALGIQQVLLKENAESAYELARLAKEIGVDYWVVKPCHPHEMNKMGYETMANLVERHRATLERAQGLSDDRFKAVVRWNFLKEVEQPRTYARCLALPFIIQIGARGDVFTCYPMSDRPEHSYGSLAEQGLEEILRSDRFRRTWEHVRDTVDVSKCMPTCRQHNANKYLWWLTEETPAHPNFV